MPLLDVSQEHFSHLGRIVRGPIPHQISNSPVFQFSKSQGLSQYEIQYEYNMYFSISSICHQLAFLYFFEIRLIQVLLMALPGRFPRSRRKRFERWEVPRREASGTKDFSTTLAVLRKVTESRKSRKYGKYESTKSTAAQRNNCK